MSVLKRNFQFSNSFKVSESTKKTLYKAGQKHWKHLRVGRDELKHFFIIAFLVQTDKCINEGNVWAEAS